MAKPNWIKEEEAAKMVGRRPKYFRSLVKKGTLDISYTTINGRSYHYDQHSIEKVLSKNAVIIN